MNDDKSLSLPIRGKWISLVSKNERERTSRYDNKLLYPTYIVACNLLLSSGTCALVHALQVSGRGPDPAGGLRSQLMVIFRFSLLSRMKTMRSNEEKKC